MPLKEILVTALKPYAEKIRNWNNHDVELLFMGFGNISIYWKGDDPLTSENLAGTFRYNAQSIVDALSELGIDGWSYVDFYWMISANAGEIRADLVNALDDAGFVCYDYYNAEENPEPQPVAQFEAEPLLV